MKGPKLRFIEHVHITKVWVGEVEFFKAILTTDRKRKFVLFKAKDGAWVWDFNGPLIETSYLGFSHPISKMLDEKILNAQEGSN